MLVFVKSEISHNKASPLSLLNRRFNRGLYARGRVVYLEFYSGKRKRSLLCEISEVSQKPAAVESSLLWQTEDLT